MAGTGFTVVHRIKQKDPILQRLICEVRYRDGYLYLDRTGRILRKLLADAEWAMTDANTGGTTLIHVPSTITLTFSSQSASLAIDKTNSDEPVTESLSSLFVQMAAQHLAYVLDELEPTEWSRIGVRQIYHFPCYDKTDSEHWVASFGKHEMTPHLEQSFGGKLEDSSFSVVISGESCAYRIMLG